MWLAAYKWKKCKGPATCYNVTCTIEHVSKFDDDQWRRQDLVRGGARISVSEKVKAKGCIPPPPKKREKNLGKNIFRQISCKIQSFCQYFIHIFCRAKMPCAPKLTELLYTPMSKLTYNTQKPVTKLCVSMHVWKVTPCRDGQKTLHWTRNRTSRQSLWCEWSPKIN